MGRHDPAFRHAAAPVCERLTAVSLMESSYKNSISMNSTLLGLRVAGTVFGLMAAAQLMRLLLGAEILVAGHSLPVWPSALAFTILGLLSVWMCRLVHLSLK